VTVKIQHGVLYIADLDPRLGTEPGKQRPVVVVQSDLLDETGHPSCCAWFFPGVSRVTVKSARS
jgi:mRNA-degrading endonuclease toxin of MazEF toxin-antitoxin module